MAVTLHMPSLGQTTDDLLIVAWLKTEGDTVAEGEPLLSVQTDKATLDVESVASGTVLAILRQAGETVPAGTPIAYVGSRGEPVLVAASSSASSSCYPPSAAFLNAPQWASNAGAGVTAASIPTHKRLASPAARQLARDHGIDLERVAGTGPEGRIETRDVRALIEGDGCG
jgi:pyruvate dehydrogenase E2 component (dihydrolipoyllysine-residue acetyltransferase)